MDIKEYDKLTSAGEILLDLFCGLLPLYLREFSEDKLTYRKNAICDSLTKVFYPSLLFSPFGTYMYLFIVDLAWCGMGGSVVSLSWARSIQPKFPEISVQNSMDRFGPTGKVAKKRAHLLRWATFPGRTGWNFG